MHGSLDSMLLSATFEGRFADNVPKHGGKGRVRCEWSLVGR